MDVKRVWKTTKKCLPAVAVMTFGVANAAFAFTVPSSSDLAYEIYDVAVNDLLKGPIGFVGGLGLVAYGLYGAVMGQGSVGTTVLALCAGGGMAAADTITETMGFLM